jgi:hypothetical protein
MLRKFLVGTFTAGVAAASAIIFSAAGVRDAKNHFEPKADHRDGSIAIIDPSADLADVYAFLNPADPTRVVLALTVNPFQAPGNGQYFSPDVLYQFKIDNTNKAGDGLDAIEDLVIQVQFSKASDDQTFSLVGPVKPKKTGTLNSEIKLAKGQSPITGPADGTVTTDSTGIKVFAGLREDPFFFDLIFGEKAAGVIKGPAVAVRTPGVDFFAGVNVSILAVELPVNLIKGASGNKVRLWATTSRSTSTKRSNKDGVDDKDAPAYVQIERMGLPTVNVVLTLPKPFNAQTGAPLGPGENQLNADLKDRFNKAAPQDDVELFRTEIVNRITQLSGDATYAGTTADNVILPDTLTLDLTSTGGFPNGRAPADDVIDTVLKIVLNNQAASDNVNSNDKPFLTEFPFFAAPNAATSGVPARDQ